MSRPIKPKDHEVLAVRGRKWYKITRGFVPSKVMLYKTIDGEDIIMNSVSFSCTMMDVYLYSYIEKNEYIETDRGFIWRNK